MVHHPQLTCFFALVMLAAPAWPQLAPEREVELAQQLYDNGRFQDALKRANDAMATSNFSEFQRMKLHEISGLAAFNLGDFAGAKKHFLQLLMLNPDHQVDPFAVPPAAVKFFEGVRQENHDALAWARQQQAIKEDQERRAQAAAEQARKEEDERARRIAALEQPITVRTIEKRSLLLNLVPFGFGQFQQGRTGLGVAFAVAQALTALASVLSFFEIASFYETYSITLTDRLNPNGSNTFTESMRRIRPAQADDYRAFSAVKYATGGAFYGLWALGIIDALVHHRSETITERKESPGRASSTTHFDLFPTRGGFGAGLTVDFD